MSLINFALLGSLGGLIRASVGLRKALRRGESFNALYFFSTIASAAIIGTALGLVVGTTLLLALAAGYAGTDLLDGIALHKILGNDRKLYKP